MRQVGTYLVGIYTISLYINDQYKQYSNHCTKHHRKETVGKDEWQSSLANSSRTRGLRGFQTR